MQITLEGISYLCYISNGFRIWLQLDPMSGGSNYQWWEEAELRELTAAVGLQNFKRHRTNRFIMFSVQKPQIL